VKDAEGETTVSAADVEKGRVPGQPVVHEEPGELITDLDELLVVLAHEPERLGR
jgi:hypothetical protein